MDGLKRLSRKLNKLEVFPYNQSQQIELAKKMAKKISIQGIQPKFSLKLSEKNQSFEVIDINGKFILKPQTLTYEE
ncbi:MAG: hypothetical protein KDD45_00880, partial [Bdellovibrionales bacterium]|nr:hypothetical protein [Bdellovibrionales bacterium]